MPQMNKLSVIRFGFFLLLSCVEWTVNAQDSVIDEVVWLVGDEVILKSDV